MQMKTNQTINLELEARILEFYRKGNQQFVKILMPARIEEISIPATELIHLDEKLGIKGKLSIEEIEHFYPENKQ